jgi:hypothetical protein
MKATNALLGIFTITLALSAQVEAQCFLTNGLVAYYPFNGNTSDASGNGNDGQIQGLDWQYGLDQIGNTNALYLNLTDPPNTSVGTYVAAPRSASLDFNQDFTLSVWVNITNGLPAYHVHNLISDGIDQTSANFRLISAFDGTNDYLQFVGGESGFSSGVYVDAHAVLAPLRNTWWQAVVVRCGTNISLYRNGALVPTTIFAMNATLSNLPQIWLGSMPLSANETPNSGEYPLDGGFDDVRMYDRALSRWEVQQLYGFEAPCLPHRAAAVATQTNGNVLGATITDGGCGYTNTPLVLILGGGGTGATATAVVSNGVVVGITITDAGTGYTSIPSIYIYSPLGLEIGLIKAVKPIFTDLNIGTNYQLQVSGDLLNTWTNQGSPFTATNPVMAYPQYFDVCNWGQLFFRLQASP